MENVCSDVIFTSWLAALRHGWASILDLGERAGRVVQEANHPIRFSCKRACKLAQLERMMKLQMMSGPTFWSAHASMLG